MFRTELTAVSADCLRSSVLSSMRSQCLGVPWLRLLDREGQQDRARDARGAGCREGDGVGSGGRAGGGRVAGAVAPTARGQPECQREQQSSHLHGLREFGATVERRPDTPLECPDRPERENRGQERDEPRGGPGRGPRQQSSQRWLPRRRQAGPGGHDDLELPRGAGTHLDGRRRRRRGWWLWRRRPPGARWCMPETPSR